MEEFTINKYLTLRLENDETNIYVDGKKILQCKYILIDIPIEDAVNNEFESIDEFIDKYNVVYNRMALREEIEELPPEVEFWGHCSNLHYWYLQQYNTNIIHHELAFPILKALTNAGDLIAKKRFKEEIAKRFGSGYFSVMEFLEKEKYLEYLNEEELDLCVKEAFENAIHKLDDRGIYWLKSKSYIGREEYLRIILNKNDAEIIIELEKLINREFVIYSYRFDPPKGGFLVSIRTEYKENPPHRDPFTKYSLEIRNKSVVILNISKCGLKTFPESITRLTKLERLILNGNEIKKIPKSILNLKNLRFFSIALCRIQDVPGWLGKLKTKTTNISGNPLNEESKKLIKKFPNARVWV